jgi:uncharacterized membrane protein
VTAEHPRVGGYRGWVLARRLGLLFGPGSVTVAAGVLAFGLVALSLLRRAQALDLPAYDNAFFQQVVWNVGHGGGFSAGFFPADFLGLHFSPLLVLPAVLELAWPDPRLLSLLHALALSASAPAGFLFLRALLGDRARRDWVAAALAAPLPFWAELQQAARAGFHTEALALPLVLLAGWAGLSARPRLAWALALVALTAREDVAYSVAVMGVLLLFHGPSRRLGVGIATTALAWALVTEEILMPGLRGEVVSQVDNYYRWLPTASPQALVGALLTPAGWAAFAGMIAGLAGLPLLRPAWFALTLPPLAAALLSAHHPQPELLFQYGLPLVVPVLVAGGLGAAWLMDRRASATPRYWVVAAAAVPALLIGVIFGPLSRGPEASSQALQRLRACTSAIPARAVVAADDAAALPLASRPVLKLSTEAARSDFLLVDLEGRTPAYVDAPRREAVLQGLPGGRRLRCEDGRFQLWSPANA